VVSIRARAALFSLLLALFAASAANAQVATTPVPQQAASTCQEPKMAKLPAKRKVDQSFKVTTNNVAPGTQWLLRIGGFDWAAGTAESDTVVWEVQMGDFGDKARKVKVEMVLANEACQNSPWKVVQKIGYPGYKTTQTKADPNSGQSQETPATSSPTPNRGNGQAQTPASKTPVVKPQKVKPFRPLRAPTDGRVWVTPADVNAHSNEKFKNPKIPRAEIAVDQAQSENALYGLSILFVVIALVTAISLIVLNKKDLSANVAIEEGRLPTHLDTRDIGPLELSAAAAQVLQKGAIPASVLEADATAPVLGEQTQEDDERAAELPTEEVAAHAAPDHHTEPDHIAAEPGDVPVPVAGAEESHMPAPPPVQDLGDAAVRPFLEEDEATDTEVPSTAEPHSTAVSAGALHQAAEQADADIADGAAAAHDQNGTAAAHDQNGAAHDQNGAANQFDEMVQAMLADSSVNDELRGIVAQARKDALEQGLPVNRDALISELERVTASAHLPGPSRDKLMARFEQIVSEELQQVSQPH